MSILTQIAQKHHWELKGDPVRLSGGFLHRMYKVHTDSGVYALKLLNPFIMQRETAPENYARAEQLEAILEREGVPVLPALSFEGRKMQEIRGNFYYVFDYFPGKALNPGEITEYHCSEMGKVLAKIHGIDRKSENAAPSVTAIDWDFCLRELETADTGLYAQLRGAMPAIESSQSKGNLAEKNLPPVLSICHNDMDCKNVLWAGENYRIIDLECLAYSNPYMELFELALCWSGYDRCQIDFQLFQAFLQGYKNSGGEMPSDWETLYDCNNGRLSWLEYNIKRILGIDCGPDEKEIGIRQFEDTVRQILYYHRMKDQILRHCIK